MNWKQLYASATPQEREAMLLSMLRTIEERHAKVILASGRLIHERRGPFPGAHFINDRRRLRPSLTRIINLLAFSFMLITVSAAAWLFILYAPPQLALPVMLLHLFGLTGILLIKPYRLKTHFARST